MGHFWNVNPEATPRQRSRLGQNRPQRTAAGPIWSLAVAIRHTRRPSSVRLDWAIQPAVRRIPRSVLQLVSRGKYRSERHCGPVKPVKSVPVAYRGVESWTLAGARAVPGR